MLRGLRLGILLTVDGAIAIAAVLAAFLARFDGAIPTPYWSYLWQLAALYMVVRLVIFVFAGMYQRLWRYASVGELINIVFVVTIGTAVAYILARLFWGPQVMPRSIVVLEWVFTVGLLGASRLTWRVVRNRYLAPSSDSPVESVVLVGAGDAGVMVAKELHNHYHGAIRILGFVDDDPLKQNARVLGYPVLGTRHDIRRLCNELAVDEIIIAMPSASRQEIRGIVEICQQTKARTKILPGVYDLIEGNVSISQIRDVDVEDLLGREPVKVDLKTMSQYIKDHVILVTGAGGSIGSELCRQVLRFGPKQLLLLDVCENNVYEIEMELRNSKYQYPLVPLVKDVKDRRAIDDVFRRYRPDVVFHAAAHKHVPLMEANPEEAIKNNTMGTFHVAQAAHAYQSHKFVLISTDKAVNPTSVMGASKRAAEMVIQSLDAKSETNFVAVRFGNVLGSRGSVIPLFKKQIARGGPVTLTHEDMVRYFMTIPEAVQLVIQAGAMAQGGEIFVLDMGDPVKILDLAETLIRLSGFEPKTDIEIEITGMRPGEKLFEELMLAEEGVGDTEHERIFVAKPCKLDGTCLDGVLQEFIQGQLPKDEQETERWLQRLLPDFHIVRHEALPEGIKAAR